MSFFFLLLSAAGCTFEEDSDPSLCDFTQGEDDDFDWLLFRTHASPYASADLLRGKCCFRSVAALALKPSESF